jgi:hypothetical protein
MLSEYIGNHEYIQNNNIINNKKSDIVKRAMQSKIDSAEDVFQECAKGHQMKILK